MSFITLIVLKVIPQLPRGMRTSLGLSTKLLGPKENFSRLHYGFIGIFSLNE